MKAMTTTTACPAAHGVPSPYSSRPARSAKAHRPRTDLEYESATCRRSAAERLASQNCQSAFAAEPSLTQSSISSTMTKRRSSEEASRTSV